MVRRLILPFIAMLLATFVSGGAGAVGAAGTTVVVTPTNTQGWSTADTRPGGTVTYVNGDAPAGGGRGSLQLTTDATTTAKAQYLHDTNTPLGSVTQLSYYTRQVSPPSPPVADPSYQVATCLNGTPSAGTPPVPTCAGFTTLVFEPYQNLGNNGNAAVVPNTWQKWDVAAGLFWSTRTVVCSNGTIAGTPGGPATYTLAAVKAACPNAVVVQFGVNVGANNPSYTVRTDLFNFNGTTYNFEPFSVPTDKDQCKDGGYKNFTDATGQPFKNQGQCVSYVESHGKDGNDGNGDHGDGGNGHQGNEGNGGDHGNGND